MEDKKEMVETKTKEEEQPQIQEVVINDELINNKLNGIAGMILSLDEKVERLIKKL